MDMALNNLQRLICHKTQPTNQPTRTWVINCKLHFTKSVVVGIFVLLKNDLNLKHFFNGLIANYKDWFSFDNGTLGYLMRESYLYVTY